MKKLLVLVIVLILSYRVDAAIIDVPADQPTIQAGINAANNGDTVLVAAGRYFENINFNGKNIVVASHYIIDNNVNFIGTTIIDGSNPSHPDTASCVLIVSGEDTSAILEGFTLTGGRGTKWLDEHGAGTYVEGGGILVTLSSPTIRNNIIIDNEAINMPGGTTSAGGGAIRCGDASARILNNIIVMNRGMYGAGLVLNYCSGTIVRNNVFSQNKVYQAVQGVQTFGGGGLWILLRIPGNNAPNIIENNTIVGNSSSASQQVGSAGIGGGLLVQNADVIIRNNIIWNNLQMSGNQLQAAGGQVNIIYNDIEDGGTLANNLSVNPIFLDSSFYLSNLSPLIDAGDPDAAYNDIEDPLNPGLAKFPSKGTIRDDIGAYGGPNVREVKNFSYQGINIPDPILDFQYILPGEQKYADFSIINLGAGRLNIDSMKIVNNSHSDITTETVFPFDIPAGGVETIIFKWMPVQNYILNDSLYVYHHDTTTMNPIVVHIMGNSNPTAFITVNTSLLDFGDIDVNTPMIDTTFYVYNIGTANDSVYISLNYQVVTPPEALAVFPASFEIAPDDSQAVTFTVYPPLINRTTLNVYQPKVLMRSVFSPGSPQYEKIMKFRLTGVLSNEDDINKPLKFGLEQNYPNPFNPSTMIKYSLEKSGFVQLKIYNVLGKEVKTLVNKEQSAGEYEIQFDAEGLSSGIYFYKLAADNLSLVRKMVMVR